MRKQYHFRPGPRGLRAWDVDRLVALTAHLTPQPVAVSAIRELDEPYWFGDENERPTCRAVLEHTRLINEAELRFPIILSADGRVMDGMHRVAKAALLGHLHVLAVRFAQDPEPDYVGVSPEELPY